MNTRKLNLVWILIALALTGCADDANTTSGETRHNASAKVFMDAACGEGDESAITIPKILIYSTSSIS